MDNLYYIKVLKIKKYLWALFFTLVCSVGVRAEDNLFSTLQDAKLSDPQIKAAMYSRLAAIEKYPQARAGILPEILLQADALRNRTDYQPNDNRIPSVDKKYYNTYDYRVKLTQPLFNWEKFIGYKQGDIELIIAEKQYQQDYQDFLLRVMKVYTELAEAVEVHAASFEQLNAVKEQYELTKTRYNVGVGDITEMREAEARFSLGQGDLIMAKRELKNKRQAFRALVGRDDNGLKLFKNIDRFAPPVPSSFDEWRQAAMSNSPEILKRAVTLEKAKMEVSRRWGGHLPSVTLTAQHTYNYADFTTGVPRGYSQHETNVGFELNFPIFSGFAAQSKIREAKYSKEQASEELEYAKRSVEKDLMEAFEFTTEGLKEVKQYKKAVEESLKSVDANRLGFKVGVRSNIDVLNSQQQVLASSKKLIKAKYGLLFYSMKLKSLVGELNNSDFQELDSF